MNDDLDDVVGQELPPFQLPTLSGDLWTEERLRGSKTVLFCFATW